MIARAQSSPFRLAVHAARAARRGELPPRYAGYNASWMSDFKGLAGPALKPGARVLDVGAGRRPMFPPDERPAGVTYVGLDVVRSELDAAPTGSYDEKVAADVTKPLASLERQFDLIVSWQVFEHLRSVPAALENFHAYLRPGGYAIVCLSGRNSLFGILNMLLPRRLGVGLVARVMRRDPETVFPAYYNHCYWSALDKLGRPWSSVEIEAKWAGAGYFRSLVHVQAAYILYEEWAAASGRNNLATHYFLQLRK